MTTKLHHLETSHGKIAVRESAGEGAPLLMIHGNSSASAICPATASQAMPSIPTAAIPWKAMPMP
jgi:hypothetical protein